MSSAYVPLCCFALSPQRLLSHHGGFGDFFGCCSAFSTPLSKLDPAGSPTIGDVYGRIESNISALTVRGMAPPTEYLSHDAVFLILC